MNVKTIYCAVCVCVSLLLPFTACAEDKRPNVFFGDKENQIRLTVGQSLSSGVEDLYTTSLIYSQPGTFFRLPSRNNLEIGGFKGKKASDPNTDLSQYNLTYLGLSKDVQLFHIDNFYVALGLGGYIKSERTHRISSKFTFGQTATLGYNADPFVIEIHARHFSNGSLTDKNAGQSFYGLAIGSNF